MKYLREFATEQEYNAYITGSSVDLPNVSVADDTNDVYYAKMDFSKQYLTFEVLSDGMICYYLNTGGGGGNEPIDRGVLKSGHKEMTYGLGETGDTYIQYSKDNGATWTDMPNELSVLEGDIVMVRGNVAVTRPDDSPIIAASGNLNEEKDVESTKNQENDRTYGSGTLPAFSLQGTTCEFNIKGNIMSIVSGDDFQNSFSMIGKSFGGLFSGLSVVNAKDLVLPATTLSENCYEAMFSSCISLETAPELPATTLAEWCYYNMFGYCTSLTTAPTISATTLAESCCVGMFAGCTNLTKAPVLPAMTMAYNCYNGMFRECTSLVFAPALPATTLSGNCYCEMFNACTSLAFPPELPAMAMAYSCYSGMFRGCTSLATAPELPATTLASDCYNGMFYGCTGLVNPPSILPAENWAYNCYMRMFYGCTSLVKSPDILTLDLSNGDTYNGTAREMFYGCSSLSYIKCLAIYVSDSGLKNWVSGVAANGTYIRCEKQGYYDSISYTFGVNGIPSGWDWYYVS